MRSGSRPDPDGRCVVYWMQRSQRPFDNPALNTAIQAGNLLGKPVVVFFRLVPHSHHANLRHYYFLVQDCAISLRGFEKRGVGFVLRRYPERGIMPFLAAVKPCLVIGDETPCAKLSGARPSSHRNAPCHSGASMLM